MEVFKFLGIILLGVLAFWKLVELCFGKSRKDDWREGLELGILASVGWFLSLSPENQSPAQTQQLSCHISAEIIKFLQDYQKPLQKRQQELKNMGNTEKE